MEPPPLPGRFRPDRLLIVLVALGVVGFGIGWMMRGGPSAMPWTCFLNDWTGIHCPGCGMTRAADAFFRGELATAFGFNPLGVILLPLTLIALTPEIIGWVRGRPPKWRLPLGKHGAWILVWIIIAFTLLRNLPWEPFSWLAP